MRILNLFLLLCLCPPSGAADAGGDAKRGAGLYYDFGCYTCHGYNGTGMTPLSKDTSGILGSETLFLTYLRLRADQNPVNPSRSMPNYAASTLSDEQALDIYAYLMTLTDDPPNIEDIPAFLEILQSAGAEDTQ